MKKNNSRKYAKALFQLAVQNNQIKEIKDSFTKLKSLYDEKTINFFSNPLVDEDTKINLIKSSYLNLPEILTNLLFILINKKELPILPEIENKYKTEILNSQNILATEVISTIQLDKPTLNKISEKTKTPIPIKHLVAAVSVGIYNGIPILDLDYSEDSKAETDMNVVMTEDGNFIEVQGTAEHGTFNQDELNTLLDKRIIIFFILLA